MERNFVGFAHENSFWLKNFSISAKWHVEKRKERKGSILSLMSSQRDLKNKFSQSSSFKIDIQPCFPLNFTKRWVEWNLVLHIMHFSGSCHHHSNWCYWDSTTLHWNLSLNHISVFSTVTSYSERNYLILMTS